MMRADDGGVDHLYAVWNSLAVCDGFEQNIPDAGSRPSEKLTVDGAPLAEFIGQIAPRRSGSRYPEYAIENASMIARRTAAFRPGLDQKRFKESPIRIRKPPSNQPRLLSRGSLESRRDSTVNYFVNRT
jgi:hypothetical protein